MKRMIKASNESDSEKAYKIAFRRSEEIAEELYNCKIDLLSTYGFLDVENHGFEEEVDERYSALYDNLVAAHDLVEEAFKKVLSVTGDQKSKEFFEI